MPGFPVQAKQLRLVVFDVDGVLTDGSLILGEQGEEYKIFNVQDGLGLVMLREAGLELAVISARSTPIVEKRMAALGIQYVYQGQRNKLQALATLLDKLKIAPAHTAYVGDDLVDLPAMELAGLGIAVANARPQVIEKADWVSTSSGGRGAVREIAEMILTAQDKLVSAIERYTQTKGPGNSMGPDN